MYGKVWAKKFYGVHAKICIFRKKLHGSTDMTPGDPQNFFYCVMTLCNDFQRSSWGNPKSIKNTLVLRKSNRQLSRKRKE